MKSTRSRGRSKSNRNRSQNNQGGNVVNRVFDSSGPEGKVRGTPSQVIEKYNQLARDAQLSNDRVAMENFQQHAEHYLRLLAEAQREIDAKREEQERQNRERQIERDRERQERQDRQEREGNPQDTNQQDNAPQHQGEGQQPHAQQSDNQQNEGGSRRDADRSGDQPQQQPKPKPRSRRKPETVSQLPERQNPTMVWLRRLKANPSQSVPRAANPTSQKQMATAAMAAAISPKRQNELDKGLAGCGAFFWRVWPF